MRTRILVGVAAVCFLVGCFGPRAGASAIFSENFNSYTPGITNTQADTGLTVGAYGSLTGWTAAGTNAIHAVQRSAGDWAVMLFETNSITLNSAIAANQLGVTYTVSFQAAAATYNTDAQGNQLPQDFLQFYILNTNDSLVASSQYATPSWTSSATNPFVNGSFTYVGTGTGNVVIQIAASNSSDNRFAGAIDNLSVSQVPEPASLFLLAAGLVGLRLTRRARA